MTESFDLVAIGTGSAASTAASRSRAAGWRVAIVDSRPFGGTCALRGVEVNEFLQSVSNPATPGGRSTWYDNPIPGGSLRYSYPRFAKADGKSRQRDGGTAQMRPRCK